ncbi:MAG: hypothetical protein IIC15_05420 [Thaumarchaeota archaeon]|nr:hypothetical protein [Nitrososphaerota archaeon]
MDERKCYECGEKGFQEYEGKFRCEKHHTEVKRKAYIKFDKRAKLMKFGIIIVAVIGVIIGSIVIYQFVSNL